jgi:Ser/Thr protein kinase RdoA (MazF antagonist)
VTALDPRALPRGFCHGDFHYANIMTLADRSIAVLDFSDCGEDFLAADLAAFFWRADFDGVADQLNPAFIAGYDSVRPLTPAERGALPLFRAARHLGVACAFAQHVNRAGPIPGFDENLRYYLSMIRLFCAQVGIT